MPREFNCPGCGGVRAYVFRKGRAAVGVAWRTDGETRPLRPARGVRAFDIMGNELSGPGLSLAASPVYLAGPDVSSVGASLD
jgi:hypothetical protein